MRRADPRTTPCPSLGAARADRRSRLAVLRGSRIRCGSVRLCVNIHTSRWRKDPDPAPAAHPVWRAFAPADRALPLFANTHDAIADTTVRDENIHFIAN